MYKDKYNKVVQNEDYILLEEEIVCQALTCDDGTMLYEELKLLKNGDVDLKDEPYYPDAYECHDLEIISLEKAINLLSIERDT